MDGTLLARIGAIVFVAIAMTVMVIELTRPDAPPVTAAARSTPTTASDPLQLELVRCQRLGEAGVRDPACLRVWAESRERFLAPSAAPFAPEAR